MADSIQVKLEGVDEFIDVLRALPAVLRRRVLAGALRDGARVIQRLAKANAPVLKGAARYRKPGTLRDAISVRTSKEARKRGDVGVFVGVRPLRGRARTAKFGAAGTKNPNDPYYWWWQEFGWTPRGAWDGWFASSKRPALGRSRAFRRQVARVGFQKVPGKRFLSMAAQVGGQQAVNTAMRRIVPQIERLNVSRIKRLERMAGEGA